MFASEHLARAAETSHDFVGNQQRASRVAPSANAAERPCRPNLHPRCSLHDWLDHDGRDFLHVK